MALLGRGVPATLLFPHTITPSIEPRVASAAGTTFGLLQRFEEADADFSRVIEANGTCADALKRRGQMRASQGRIADAMQDLTHALSLTPLDGEILYEQGCCQRSLHDFAAAKVCACRCHVRSACGGSHRSLSIFVAAGRLREGTGPWPLHCHVPSGDCHLPHQARSACARD